MPTAYVGPWRLAEPIPLDPSVDNTWGTILNTNTSLLQEGATGQTTVDLTGLSTYGLTVNDGASDQSRPAVQFYTGALTTNCIVTLPNVAKYGWAVNNTTPTGSSGYNVILSCGVGTSGTIPPDGSWYPYYTDGSGNVVIPNITKANSYTFLEVASLQVSGELLLNFPTSQLIVLGAASSINAVTFPSGGINSAIIVSGNASIAATMQCQTSEAYFYITLSDYRLKVDFGPYQSGGDVIDAVPVHDAALKEWPDVRRPMFFAHELPVWAVSGEKDAVDEEGKDKYQGVDIAALVPLLWREVQELRLRVKALESR